MRGIGTTTCIRKTPASILDVCELCSDLAEGRRSVEGEYRLRNPPVRVAPGAEDSAPVRAVSDHPPAIPPNRAVAHFDAELEHLGADPLGAPQAIVAR